MEPAATFGPRLRQERERRHISLKSIAENTKISRSLLEALERDDVSRWPTGIFRRSFVRSYALAIGLDADEIAREFAERFPDPTESPAPALETRSGRPLPPPPALSRQAPPDRAQPERVEVVLRFSVPRWLVSWMSRLTWLTGRTLRAATIPGRQNT
jgi:transcriptional regulator with XRE-family HTH domain